MFTLNKMSWPKGPWDDEPDRLEWRHCGFPCLIVRGGHGALCGYVAVQEGHPFYGKPYDDVQAHPHGGLTYSGGCGKGHICHTRAAGESERIWWLGFDCAHAGDLTPAIQFINGADIFSGLDLADFNGGLGRVYRTIDYVRSEVEKLAEDFRDVIKKEATDAGTE